MERKSKSMHSNVHVVAGHQLLMFGFVLFN